MGLSTMPFAAQSRQTGTGMGLVLSRRIAESHGDSLTGANRLEGGVRFVLRLPAPVGGAPPAARRRHSHPHGRPQ